MILSASLIGKCKRFVVMVLLAVVATAYIGCGGGHTTPSTSPPASSTPAPSQPPSTPGPAAVLAPTSVAFGNQVVNSTSPAQTVTLTNTGGTALSISAIGITGDFTQTNNCGTSLAAGTSCKLSLGFTPSATGARSGVLTISDNAAGSPHQVALSGTGVAPGQLTATPATVAFGNVTLGSSSTRTVQLSNPGAATVTISSASFSGAGFNVTGLTTPLTLTPAQTASFTVTFAPSSAGSVTGSVQLTNSGPTSPLIVPVSGTGVAAVSHSVNLQWNPSTSAVAGYNVYRSTQSGAGYNRLNTALTAVSGYVDSSVVAGATYFYVVTAVDTNNVESGYSNQVSATIPTP